MAHPTGDELEFNCTQCGLCCAVIGVAVEFAKDCEDKTELQQELADFPHKYDETGRCEHLTTDNKCGIYDHRPRICNVRGMHQKYFRHMDIPDFFAINEAACKELQNVS